MASEAAQLRGVGAGVLVVARDDQPGRVGHAPAHLGKPFVGRLQHLADPLAGWVERGPPGLRDLLLGHRGAQGRGDLVAGPGAPAHLAGVGQEDHRPDDPVLQRVRVTVDVIGGAAPGPVQLLVIADERDRVGVAAERRAGQRDPPPGRVERLPDRVAPGHSVPGVVDLVEDDQGAAAFGALPVQRRMGGHLGVRDGHADEIGGCPALGVPVGRVQRNAEAQR